MLFKPTGEQIMNEHSLKIPACLVIVLYVSKLQDPPELDIKDKKYSPAI